jgi:probable DNA metabolism protein
VQQDIFSGIYNIETDFSKSARVAAGIRVKISVQAFENAYLSFSCPEISYMDLFNYIILGFKLGYRITNYQTVAYVGKIEALASKTEREAHRYTGFARFRETKSGVLYAAIAPDNYIIPILAEHFANRLIDEKWIIHDTRRGLCAIYNGKEYAICEADNKAEVELSDTDAFYQRLWRRFYETIAVEDRINVKRLNHILPKKFRDNLTEFQLPRDQDRGDTPTHALIKA